MAIFSAIAGAIGQAGAQAGGNMAGDAANRAAQYNQQEAQRGRIALSPWSSTGETALNKINNLLGLGELTNKNSNDGKIYVDPANAKNLQTQALADFQTTPGYQFRVDEGVKALDRSAASRGMLRSGAQAKGVTDFGQQMGSQEYGNYFGNLMSLAGMGGQAASSANSTSGQLVNSAGQMITAGGMARGSGYSEGAKALAGGISSGVNNVMAGLGYGGQGGKLGIPKWS